MSELKIIDKLATRLNSLPSNEEGVIFLLSRIRKILEIYNHPDQFIELNFYCNLALHSKITRPPVKITTDLEKIISGTDYPRSLFLFSVFDSQLQLFLEKYQLPNPYKESTQTQIESFHFLLLEILSDTPILILYNGIEYKVRIEKHRDTLVFSFTVPPVYS